MRRRDASTEGESQTGSARRNAHPARGRELAGSREGAASGWQGQCRAACAGRRSFRGAQGASVDSQWRRGPHEAHSNRGLTGMITLHTFGPYFGLPDPSPFVMKAEMLLKLSGLRYETTRRGFRGAPKGKLPYIRDGETVVADSTLIRLHLEQKHHIDFDRGLSPHDRGVGWAVEKMLEDHLYWIMVYWRWLNPENFARGPAAFFERAPAPIRPLAKWFVLRRLRGTLHRHGIGRHSEAETTTMAARGIESLAQI